MKKYFFALSFLIFSATLSFAQTDISLPDGQMQVIDDFENGNYWIWACSDWDQWGGHKVSQGADLSKRWSSQGKYSLHLVIDSVKDGDDASWFYDGGQDLTGGRYIVADFYNPTPLTHKIAFVIQVTDNWNWKQSPLSDLPPGVHTMVFPVEELNEHFDEVRRINIIDRLSGNHSGDTSIFVDNIRLIK